MVAFSGNTCHTQLGQGDVIMSSCLENAGHLIVYLLHNHIAVQCTVCMELIQSCDWAKGSHILQWRTSMLTRINLDFLLLTMATTTTFRPV